MKRICLLVFTLVGPGLAEETWMVHLNRDDSLRLINPEPRPVSVSLRLYNATGVLLTHQTITMNALEATTRPLDAWVGDDVGPVSLRANTIGRIFLATLAGRGEDWVGIRARSMRAAPVIIPHVAEATEHWNTEAYFVTSAAMSPLSLAFPHRTQSLPVTTHHASLGLDLESLAGSDMQAGEGWAVMESTATRLTGGLLFATENGQQAAWLDDRLDRSNVLILPHIPSDTGTWWAGLALLNTHHQHLNLRFDLWGNDGLIESRNLTLGARQKKVSTLSTLFDAPLPAAATWMEIRGNLAFTGFELFGTTNGQTLAGLPLTAGLTKHAVFGFSGDRHTWNGVVLLNPGTSPMEITLSMIHDSGEVLSSTRVSLGARQRKALIPESLLGNPAGQAWIRLESTFGFQAFQLLGDLDQTRLAAFTPQNAVMDDVLLDVPKTIIQGDMTTLDFPTASDDFDGDGLPELAVMTPEKLLFLDYLDHEIQQASVPWADFGFENPQDIPPTLATCDLNQDEILELLIVTHELWICSVDPSFHVSLFQPMRVDMENDQSVRDFADVNLDGYLDILANNAWFISVMGPANVYSWNSFPYKFQTNGRGSAYMHLNDDPYTDVVTTLFDGVYAIETRHIPDDPQPVYIPSPYQDVIDLKTFDVDCDGKPEIVSFLAESANANRARTIDVARIDASSGTSLFQFQLDDDSVVGMTRALPGDCGSLSLKENYGSTTRFFHLDAEGFHLTASHGFHGHVIDFNGDGIQDMMDARGLILGDPLGITGHPALCFLDPKSSTREVIPYVGDFNHDQHLDVLALDRQPGGSFIHVSLWSLMGDGSSAQRMMDFSIQGAVLAHATLWDYDHDGDLDFTVLGAGLYGYENQDGQISQHPQVIHGVDRFSASKAMPCDINNNGIPDALIRPPGQTTTLDIVLDYPGNSPQVVHTGINVSPETIRLADFNDDGWVDLAANDPLRPRVLLINQGNGNFKSVPVEYGVEHFCALDFNGDGLLDITGFVNSSDQSSQYLRLIENKRDDRFLGSLVVELPRDTYYTTLLALDFNEDGRDDLIAVGTGLESDTQYVDFWENRVTDPISELPFRLLMRSQWPAFLKASLTDMNLDGRLDLQIWEAYNGMWYRQRVPYHPAFFKTTEDASMP